MQLKDSWMKTFLLKATKIAVCKLSRNSICDERFFTITVAFKNRQKKLARSE